MIIPVRCFTCNKVLGDKWEYFKKQVEKHEKDTSSKQTTLEDITVRDKNDAFFLDGYKGKILNELNITKLCCRRHLLGHVDLIDLI
jgi:DNA-directed RNA polymerase subunit N